MRIFFLSVILATLSISDVTVARTYCRPSALGLSGVAPHQATLWSYGFPVDPENQPRAICEGTIKEQDDGGVCITGKVSYAQVQDYLERPVFSPLAESISITGHMTAGSGNVVLGTKAQYLYDFITSYTIEGVEYTADATMIDKLLAASEGRIDGVCLSKEFSDRNYYYTISHEFWLPSQVQDNIHGFVSGNQLYISAFSFVAEYYERGIQSPLPAAATNLYSTFAANASPSFVYSFIPLFGFTGIFRYFVNGFTSTNVWPRALVSPTVDAENIQLDVPLSSFRQAILDGLFVDSNKRVPLFMSVAAKTLNPPSDSFGCWTEPTIAVDVQAPLGFGREIDYFVDRIVYPAFAAHGDVGLHFGKRIPERSDTLTAALSFYQSCGATIPKTPTICYHPMCERSSAATEFEYPQKYYDDTIF